MTIPCEESVYLASSLDQGNFKEINLKSSVEKKIKDWYITDNS